MKHCTTTPFLIVLFILCTSVFALAGEYDNRRALHNLSTAKTYFDVNVGIANKLVTRLQLIDATYNQLRGAGVTPDFVIGFRGKASNFVTNDNKYVSEEELVAKKKVQAWVKKFKVRGIAMEQCEIATRLLKINPKDILPEVDMVQNGYISMIGYQTKGYAQIPMD